MAKAAKSFEEELAERDAALEAARAAKAEDPEGWAKVSTEYTEWRRGIRMLGGRPLGDPPYPPDVQAFADAQPTEQEG